jgi:glycosyltransferase involved in cell wall biosynthesis
VLIELAEAMRDRGALVDLVQPSDYGAAPAQHRRERIELSEKLRQFLRALDSVYDVIEYDHEQLPFARSDFDPRALLVARSVLLVHHLERITFPQPHTPRAIAGRLLLGWRRNRFRDWRIERATRTIQQSDLVNVSNGHDKDELLRRGVQRDRVIVLPFGMSADRRRSFEQVCCLRVPPEPIVGFVGTFDYRKGALDIARVFELVCAAVPATRLRLLGTAGLVTSARDVLSAFPRSLRRLVDVRPRFDSEDLPSLLSDCTVGIFPSYCEGFGFGVLEMLAAAMPVIAYDGPGPPMMLPQQWLVPAGARQQMADKLIALLHDPAELSAARVRARAISTSFDWRQIAQRTLQLYGDALQRHRQVSDVSS